MPKKKKGKDEERTIDTWVSLGVMLGSISGMVLSLQADNFIYLGAGCAGGLILGLLIGTVLSEEEIRIKTKSTKKKKNKRTTSKVKK